MASAPPNGGFDPQTLNLALGNLGARQYTWAEQQPNHRPSRPGRVSSAHPTNRTKPAKQRAPLPVPTAHVPSTDQLPAAAAASPLPIVVNSHNSRVHSPHRLSQGVPSQFGHRNHLQHGAPTTNVSNLSHGLLRAPPQAPAQSNEPWLAVAEARLHEDLASVGKQHLYIQLKDVCARRLCPPLMGELVGSLSISSLTQQRIAFEAINRHVWNHLPHHPARHQYEQQASLLFAQDQFAFYERQNLIGNADGPNVEQTLRGNRPQPETWASEYKRLFQAFLKTHGQSTQIHPTARQYQWQPPQILTPRQNYPPAHPRTTISTVTTTSQQQQVQHVLVRGLLLPQPGFTLPAQRIASPVVHALHQAHLANPILKTPSSEPRWYHVVTSCLLKPCRLKMANRSLEQVKFNADSETFENLVKDDQMAHRMPNHRQINAKSRTAHLRCIKWPSDNPNADHEWFSSETSCIPYSYFSLNGVSLQQRKKVHHGKDLPIEITEMLKEGDNVLEVSVIAEKDDMTYQKYLLAVELLTFISHSDIVRHCQENTRIAAPEALQQIKQRLSDSNFDDDICILDSSMTIRLSDPLSLSNVCNIPVRGKNCLHVDCFDLETFLHSRPRVGDVSVADQWRCPICNTDARPKELVIDGFIEQVQDELKAKGLLTTSVIAVNQDGSWQAKTAERTGVSDESPALNPAQLTAPSVIEVIDISD